MSEHGDGAVAESGHQSAQEAASGASLPGLAIAQDGYRLVPEVTTMRARRPSEFGFRITADQGATVSDFDLEHDRRMHLIVVRRDFQGFQHLHPVQRPDGSWSVEVGALAPGVYRVFADFATAGRSLTLATDLFVGGDFEPEALPAVSDSADAGGGYEVEIDSAAPTGATTVPVEFSIRLNGRKLDAVQPYLGADGHLVALREGDQAFLHTHPEGEPGGAGPISFQVEYPTAGRYRLFLQFKHSGAVRTAAFTQIAREDNAGSHGHGLTGHLRGHG